MKSEPFKGSLFLFSIVLVTPFVKKFLIILGINFTGLAIGAYFQGDIETNVWYAKLKTSEYTPPLWSFVLAWIQIMLFYSAYLVVLLHKLNWHKVALPFALSWFLNLLWNPSFFNFHQIGFALFLLVALFFVILYLFVKYKEIMEKKTLLLMPYLLWLIIAFSLNGYVFLYN